MAIIAREILRYTLTRRLLGTMFCERMGRLVTCLHTGGIREGTQDWPGKRMICVSECNQDVDA